MADEADEVAVDTNVCARKRCSAPSALVHLGEPLCDKHWEELCAADERRVARELQQLFNEDPVAWGPLRRD